MLEFMSSAGKRRNLTVITKEDGNEIKVKEEKKERKKERKAMIDEDKNLMILF